MNHILIDEFGEERNINKVTEEAQNDVKYKIKQLEGAIKAHKKNIPEDIKQYSFTLGALLRKQDSYTKDINKYATLIDINNKRLEAIQSVTPESFMKYIDDYYMSWDKIEFKKEILNTDIILSYLHEKLPINKFLTIKTILQGEDGD